MVFHCISKLIFDTSQSFPRSWLITGFVTRLTRRVSLVEQEVPTLPEHLCSPPVFSWVRVTRSLVLFVCYVDRCLSFVRFLLAIVLSVLLRYADSDYPFGFFKFFFNMDCGVRLLGQNACYVIWWNNAHKHRIYMNRVYCNSFHFLWFDDYWEFISYQLSTRLFHWCRHCHVSCINSR
jgi:hypothetical protein